MSLRNCGRLGEVLAGVDLDLEAQGLRRLVLRREAVDEVHPAFPEVPAGSAEPWIEHGANRVERVADRLGRHLYEVDVLGERTEGRKWSL